MPAVETFEREVLQEHDIKIINFSMHVFPYLSIVGIRVSSVKFIARIYIF